MKHYAIRLRCKAIKKSDQFANEENFDFEDAVDKTPTQEFDVAQGREVGEYAVKYVSLPAIT